MQDSRFLSADDTESLIDKYNWLSSAYRCNFIPMDSIRSTTCVTSLLLHLDGLTDTRLMRLCYEAGWLQLIHVHEEVFPGRQRPGVAKIKWGF
jgi:hypothetical protein